LLCLQLAWQQGDCTSARDCLECAENLAQTTAVIVP
jgi:hypothetical protein